MQFKFLFAFVLLGACLAQISSAHPTENQLVKNIIDDLIEKAKEAIEKLTKLIQEQIEKAKAIIDEIVKKVTEEANKIIANVKQQLQEIADKINAAIEEIKKKAEELGIDISECLKDNEDRIQAFVEEFLANEIQCVKTETDQVAKIVSEAIEMFNEAAQTIGELPEKLKACTSSSNPIGCIKDVIVHAIEAEKDLPAQIAQKIKEIQEFVAGFEVRVEVCATTELANAAIRATEIVADVAKCAADKEHEQPGIVFLKRRGL